MPKSTESENVQATPEAISRKDFLMQELSQDGVALPDDLPTWIETLEDGEFKDLIEICTKLLEEDQVLDILDAKLDLQGAIGACFNFLIENGEDPEEILIEYGFLQIS